MTERSRAWLTVSLATAAAFLLRVVPSWHAVFRADAISFQEGDAWFHVRTIHNLLAHFPIRSGFDPYMLFPGGQNIPTGPVWDYVNAIVAWMAGLGSPSDELIDRVAAFTPAVFGALFVPPVFWLARMLGGFECAAYACLWVATTPGAFLWFSHLGLADHHAAEALFAIQVLVFLCIAVESDGWQAILWAVLSGVAMGAFLATRPAGIFVPMILAVTAMLSTRAARPVLIAVLVAALLFVPVSGIQWSNYTWLALGVAASAAGASMLLGTFTRWLIPFAALLLAGVVRPGVESSLWYEVRRLLGWEAASRIAATVQELQPIYRAGDHPGWAPVFDQLGIVWVMVLPALVWLFWRALAEKRAAFLLVAVWSLVVSVAAVMELRMVVYFAPAAAILAGITCAWLIRLPNKESRPLWAGGLVLLILGLNVRQAIPQVGADLSPSPDWHRAMHWLQGNSPEPFAQPGVWSAMYPRVHAPSDSPPAARWGVAVWWDFGYLVEQIGRRIPMSNGTQSGVGEMAQFFLDTVPESATRWARQHHARYVVVDPSSVASTSGRTWFPLAVRISGRDSNDYFRVLAQPSGQTSAVPVYVYLPDYYRTMAVRLYGYNHPSAGSLWVFETETLTSNDGRQAELIRDAREFPSEEEADRYVTEHADRKLTMGCVNPRISCFALPAIPGIRQVYSSSEGDQSVRIFEIGD